MDRLFQKYSKIPVLSAAMRTTQRLERAISKGGWDNPWYVNEIPTIFVSFNCPFHLADVPQVKNFVNYWDEAALALHRVIWRIRASHPIQNQGEAARFSGTASRMICEYYACRLCIHGAGIYMIVSAGPRPGAGVCFFPDPPRSFPLARLPASPCLRPPCGRLYSVQQVSNTRLQKSFIGAVIGLRLERSMEKFHSRSLSSRRRKASRSMTLFGQSSPMT